MQDKAARWSSVKVKKNECVNVSRGGGQRIKGGEERNSTLGQTQPHVAQHATITANKK